MKINQIVLKEIFQRVNQIMFSLLAITLGIAVIVGIKNITIFSEKAVSRELDTLGANILILPKSASVQDYYSADFQDADIPESYVDTLVSSGLQGLDNLSPKLSLPVEVSGRKTILTGILPMNEFKSKDVWQGELGIFARPEGCGSTPTIPGLGSSSKTLVRKRVVNDLEADSILVGHDIASTLNLKENGTMQIMGRTFRVEAILPGTGTVDDNRIFAHLHTVQKMSDKPGAINVVEVVGCCNEISKGLVSKINKLLPDAKVVTITQIVQTQVNTNRLMKGLSFAMLVIIAIIGVASISNYMFSNVYERRREIGIYMAMGSKPSWIVQVFMLKALYIGLIGGVLGYVIGTIMALTLGPKMMNIPVWPVPILGVYAVAISLAIALGASVFPVIQATKVDPFIIMQED
ncbi:MAG: ABC transporter permease [Candidatus Omnitrophica bacterium]|nr:ABC transporter permease [Candidatus Omnitrophota bacterium]